MFLVYNTVSASVLTRRQEIGMLRAVGTSRSTVFALFLGEALCLAAPGCALGLVVGRLLAQGAVTLTSRTVSRCRCPRPPRRHRSTPGTSRSPSSSAFPSR